MGQKEKQEYFTIDQFRIPIRILYRLFKMNRGYQPIIIPFNVKNSGFCTARYGHYIRGRKCFPHLF